MPTRLPAVIWIAGRPRLGLRQSSRPVWLENQAAATWIPDSSSGADAKCVVGDRFPI
jgi:hypothetical protein